MEIKEYYEMNQNTFSEEAMAEMNWTERTTNNSEEWSCLVFVWKLYQGKKEIQ